MEKLKYINVLEKTLWDEYILKIVNPLTRKYIEIDNFDHTHVLLFGRFTYITRMVARKHVMNKCDSKYSDLHHVCVDGKFKSFSKPLFIEIDLNIVDQAEIIDAIKPIIKSKPFNSEKHKIIMHGLCKASKNLQFALRKLIELYCDNVYIIFTSDKLDSIEVSLKSRLTMINCNCDITKLKELNAKLINCCRSDLQIDDYDKIIELASSDPLNVIIILELDNPMDYKNIKHIFINSSIEKLISMTNKKEHDIIVKDISYKLSAICTTIKEITECILDYQKHIGIKKYNDIIEMAAKIEENIGPSNKIFFSLEMYINSIVEILKN
jgi:hypothetical protein